MPIKATCTCGQSFQAPDELAGKQVKCPACGGAFAIPSPSVANSIAVACQCGQSFKAKPELAGRTVKCPSCGGVLAIPEPQTGTAAHLGAGRPDRDNDPFAGDDLSDPLALGSKAPNAFQSPTAFPPDAAPDGHQGSSYGSSGWRGKAAPTRAKPPTSNKGLMIGAAIVAGLILVVLVVTLANQIGWLVAVAGWLVALVCNIWILVIAFNEDLLQGLLCLFVPFYALFFVISNWDECQAPFLGSLGGLGLVILGLSLSGFGWM